MNWITKTCGVQIKSAKTASWKKKNWIGAEAWESSWIWSRKIMKNAPILAIRGVDPATNERFKLPKNSKKVFEFLRTLACPLSTCLSPPPSHPATQLKLYDWVVLCSRRSDQTGLPHFCDSMSEDGFKKFEMMNVLMIISRLSTPDWHDHVSLLCRIASFRPPINWEAVKDLVSVAYFCRYSQQITTKLY